MLPFYIVSNLTYGTIVLLCARLAYKRKNHEYKKPQKVLACVYFGSLFISTFLDPINTLIDLVIEDTREYFLVNCIFQLFYYTIPSAVVLLNIILAVHLHHFTLLCRFHFLVTSIAIIIYAILFTTMDASCYLFYDTNNTCQVLVNAPQYTSAMFYYTLIN